MACTELFPWNDDNYFLPRGSAVSNGVSVPSGSAASGSDATTRAAQSPSTPPLAPATGVQEAKTLGESAGDFLGEKCPVGRLTVLSGKYKFPQRVNGKSEQELDWPYHLPYQKTEVAL
eukprot:7675310-Pyramimonas_sp.AAC.1